ncbi:MAG: exo-alpha-sialidase [Planctomycetes bacterium]|nr:exo-alpha-sialidase [Planctomycetota bacterium]
MTLTLAALLICVQDEGWSRPVELAKDRTTIPWALARVEGGLALAAIRIEDGRGFTWMFHLSKDAGRNWTKTGEFEAGKMDGPPAALVRGGRLLTAAVQDGKKLTFRSFDLATGKPDEAISIDVEGLDKVQDDVWPTLVEHGGALHLLCAKQDERDRIFVLRSADGGKKWSALPVPEWTTHHRDGCRALLFAAGRDLHVVFSPDREMASISHYSSADGGKSWTDRKTAFPADGSKVFPMAVAVDGDRVCIAYGRGSSKAKTEIRAMTSADGGRTWAAGGTMLETRVDDMSLLCSVAVAGEKAAFFGLTFSPEQKQVGTAVVLSRDGGRTWKDLDLSERMKQVNLFSTGTFSADGSELYVAFVNAADMSVLEGRGEGHLLFRRWGRPEASQQPPLTEEERKQVLALVERLGDEDLEAREEATRKLIEAGERALPLIREVLGRTKEGEVRSRLEAVVAKIVPPWWKG